MTENVADIVESVVQSKSKPKPSGKSLKTDEPLSTDPDRPKKDIKKMAKQTKATATGQNMWDNAPAEVLAVFEDMMAAVAPLSSIAKAHNTSTRTMGRWSDKYNYDGWVVAQTAPAPVVGTVAEQAIILFKNWRKAMDASSLAALVEFKKARKKGWGTWFSATQEKQILKAMA